MASDEQIARARGMQQANALFMLRDIPWDSIDDKERGHWITLAEMGDLAVESYRRQIELKK